MQLSRSSEYREYLNMPLPELMAEANRVRMENFPEGEMQLCSIINAKSGKCSEDCKYCAQAGCHKTNVDVYPLRSKDIILEQAKRAEEAGARRFSMVTSGNRLNARELDIVCETTQTIIEETGLSVCGSMGALSMDDFAKLKEAGMTRYHHNIETSRNHYAKIVSTHDFNQRVETVQKASSAGFKICCGGILGLGETLEDRISMAETIKSLPVDSVPLNILVPIKGTRLFGIDEISPMEVIRTIAIFRLILPDRVIRVIAGRESRMKDYQAMAFMAGANGMMVGGYLTVNGRSIEEDRELVAEIERIWKRDGGGNSPELMASVS